MKRRICCMFLALAMVFALVACGSTSDEDSATSDSSTSNSTDADSTQREVLNVALEEDCTDFNPFTFSGTGANLAIFQLYQPLLWPIDGEYYPSILKSYEMSEDGLTMYGEMFDYITDWEGNEIIADDVVFCWGKACEAYPQNSERVESIVATGEYTIEVTFNHELDVDGLETVAKLFVVSQKAYEESEDEMHSTPVGTGSYKLTSYTSGYMFTYEKVDDWWQTDESVVCDRDVATVDTINWYVISESSQRTIALEQGTVDVCSSVSSEDLDKFDGQNGYWLYSIDANLSMDLFPNCDETSLCSDLNLRLAICYAINSETILNSVYNGEGTVMHELAPSWSVGYDEAWDEEDNYYQYDVETAQSYLDASDYNGETLKIICQTDANSTGTAQIVQNFLVQIGIETEINSYESSVFTEYIEDPSQWDIMIYTRPTNTYWINGIYSPMSAERYSWNGSINFVYDETFEEMILNCYTMSGHTEENRQELHEYMIENCYAMGLVNPVSYTVVPDDIVDVVLSWRKNIIPGASIYG